MAAGLLPLIRWRAIDEDGQIVPGSLLYCWAAGTATPQAVYEDVDLTTALGTIIEADAGGLFPGMYLQNTGYKFGLYPANAAPPVVPTDQAYWVQDNFYSATIFGATFGTQMTAGASLNVTTGYVVAASDTLVTVASSGATVVNLPTVSTRALPVLIQNRAGGTVVITPNGSDTIQFSEATFTLGASSAPTFTSAWLFPLPGSGTWVKYA